MLNAILITLSMVGSARAAGSLSPILQEIAVYAEKSVGYSLDEILESITKALNEFPETLTKLIKDQERAIVAAIDRGDSTLEAQLEARKAIFERLLAQAKESNLKPQDIKGLSSSTIIAIAGAVGLGGIATGYFISKETQ